MAAAMSDPHHRRIAPAAARNRQPILDVLRPVLPSRGCVLEVASGSGEHVIHFATALTRLEWQPSDPDAVARASIAAWTQASALANIRPPIDLDAARAPWPIDAADAILCINMVHISPWEATEGLFAQAGRLLAPGAPLYLYGPWLRDGFPTAPTNLAFDADLRARNRAWGLREVNAARHAARAHALRLDEIVEMPANNLSLIFRRSG